MPHQLLFFLCCFFASSIAYPLPEQKQEIIIKFKEHTPTPVKTIQENFPTLISLSRPYPLPRNTFLFAAKTPFSSSQLKQLEKHSIVAYAEFNQKIPHPIADQKESGHHDFSAYMGNLYSIYPFTNDPLLSKQWAYFHPNGVALDRAWEITTGTKDIVIAVIDTGVNYLHEDLVQNMWINKKERDGKPNFDDDQNGYTDDIYGYDFFDNDPDPMDVSMHGTHCAGIIGAIHNNNLGVAGVMRNVSIMALKHFGKRQRTDPLAAAAAIDYAIKMKADIISASWGSKTYSNVLKEAIQRAADAGIPYVTAASNQGVNIDHRVDYPTHYGLENVITVASHNKNGKLTSTSSFGHRTVDISAPGTSILSTIQSDRYVSMSGTSMATPMVAAAIGLYFSHHGKVPVRHLKRELCASTNQTTELQNKVICGGSLNIHQFLLRNP